MRNEFVNVMVQKSHRVKKNYTKLLEVNSFICDVLSAIIFVKCFEYYLNKYPASATLTIT